MAVLLQVLLIHIAAASETCTTATPTEPRKVLSWAPRLVHLPRFWNASVCDHVVEFAKTNVLESPSTTDAAGVHVHSVRRSSSFWLQRKQEYGPQADPIVRAAVMAMHEEVMLAPYHGEDLQITRYQKNGFYEFHHDTDARMATMVTFLVFLNDVDEGGETIFPFIENPLFNESLRAANDLPLQPPVDPRHPGAPVAPMAAYCKSDRFLKIRPRKGDALVLYNIAPSLVLDNSAWHAGCPVGKGEKWIAQKWMKWQTLHGRRFVEGNRKINEMFNAKH